MELKLFGLLSFDFSFGSWFGREMEKEKIACTKASIRSLTHIVFTYLSLIITSN